jgi:hypothetical protein
LQDRAVSNSALLFSASISVTCLPTIVDGTDTDNVKDKPFVLHFTKDKILWLWAKIGFVPFTRSCFAKQTGYQKELGQHNEDAALKDLQLQ